jgi:hypothetical protein
MSRNITYQDQRLTVVTGVDQVLGNFIQLYDKDMQNETPEGEGLVFDWSQGFGIETNYTGIPNSMLPDKIVNQYVLENNFGKN